MEASFLAIARDALARESQVCPFLNFISCLNNRILTVSRASTSRPSTSGIRISRAAAPAPAAIAKFSSPFETRVKSPFCPPSPTFSI